MAGRARDGAGQGRSAGPQKFQDHAKGGVRTCSAEGGVFIVAEQDVMPRVVTNWQFRASELRLGCVSISNDLQKSADGSARKMVRRMIPWKGGFSQCYPGLPY